MLIEFTGKKRSKRGKVLMEKDHRKRKRGGKRERKKRTEKRLKPQNLISAFQGGRGNLKAKNGIGGKRVWLE